MSAGEASKNQMVAIDIDGTLLRGDKRLSLKVVTAVKMASKKGVKVVLATARPPRSVKEIYNILGLNTIQINYNGALIYDPAKKNNLLHLQIDPDVVLRVIRFARKKEPSMVVSMEDLDRSFTDRIDPNLQTETDKYFPPAQIASLEEFLKQPITKLMLMAKPHLVQAVKPELEARFKDQVCFAASDPHLMQVMNKAADKAHALAWVAGHYNILPEHVMAIGDAPNDSQMLAWAGLGVAVGNAWTHTKNNADVIVPSNDEDGVAYAINRYVLDQ
jgi:Cof subfamily protein (haloacid dehalogenase superfamily)